MVGECVSIVMEVSTMNLNFGKCMNMERRWVPGGGGAGGGGAAGEPLKNQLP